MKKFLLFILCFLFAFVAMCAVQEPTCFKLPDPWWYSRHNNELFGFTDHNGKTNKVTVSKSDEVCKASAGWNDASIVFGKDLQWIEYTVKSASVGRDYSYNIENIAPGVYSNGLFYTQMTLEQKTALWVAYTNKLIQAYWEHQKVKYADAKFDVSMDPEEYKAQLMEGRTEEDLTPDERREIMAEYRKYYDEWLRINDPDKWDFPIGAPGRDKIISEQAKKGKGGVGIISTKRGLRGPKVKLPKK